MSRQTFLLLPPKDPSAESEDAHPHEGHSPGVASVCGVRPQACALSAALEAGWGCEGGVSASVLTLRLCGSRRLSQVRDLLGLLGLST